MYHFSSTHLGDPMLASLWTSFCSYRLTSDNKMWKKYVTSTCSLHSSYYNPKHGWFSWHRCICVQLVQHNAQAFFTELSSKLLPHTLWTLHGMNHWNSKATTTLPRAFTMPKAWKRKLSATGLTDMKFQISATERWMDALPQCLSFFFTSIPVPN